MWFPGGLAPGMISMAQSYGWWGGRPLIFEGDTPSIGPPSRACRWHGFCSSWQTLSFSVMVQSINFTAALEFWNVKCFCAAFLQATPGAVASSSSALQDKSTGRLPNTVFEESQKDNQGQSCTRTLILLSASIWQVLLEHPGVHLTFCTLLCTVPTHIYAYIYIEYEL